MRLCWDDEHFLISGLCGFLTFLNITKFSFNFLLEPISERPEKILSKKDKTNFSHYLQTIYMFLMNVANVNGNILDNRTKMNFKGGFTRKASNQRVCPKHRKMSWLMGSKGVGPGKFWTTNVSFTKISQIYPKTFIWQTFLLQIFRRYWSITFSSTVFRLHLSIPSSYTPEGHHHHQQVLRGLARNYDTLWRPLYFDYVHLSVSL